MDLVALAQAAQDRDRLLDGRLVDEDRLEAPLEGGVLLDVLAVLVERRRADRVELAAREHRLEQVGGVHRAFGRARRPTTVWSSSMNRITWPSASLISLRTALSRSSNSPRNLAPAMSAPRSSETTRLSLRPSGTSPRTIRWARPSAMAVLPTPGSPMRTGLFFVRRRQHLDDAADLVVAADDRVELAGSRLGGEVAAVLLERGVGALGVRGGDALAAADALERLEDGLAPGCVALEEGLALAADLGDREQQVLGRDVVVAEAPRLGLGALDDAPRARIQGQRAALDPGPPGEDRGELAAERRQVDAEPAERLGRDAVVGLDERGEDVLGVEDRAVEALGGGLGGDDGLLGLLGESVELHSVSLSSADRVSAGWVGRRGRGRPGRRPAPRRTGRSAG